nr:M56 family metallopeptidase [uncultured Mucilaginibacter sp.]
MIAYILKSAICLATFLVVYHLFFEKMKMHRFNRFYLLLSLVAGLVLPALTIEISTDVLDHTPLLSNTMALQEIPSSFPTEVSGGAVVQESSSSYNFETLLILFYSIIACVLAIRFVRNLAIIHSRIYKNPRQKIKEGSLVMLSNDVLPHSFLSHIFINEDDYREGRIDEQLLEHELTHVRQMHSLDILFVEIIKIIFWFNPVFVFYKKAIQLNHEFLADEAVVCRYEVSAYQYLLLKETNLAEPSPLASNLNYSLTKKRLTMMIKTTSKLKIWTARVAVLPVLAAMLFLFSMKSVTKVYTSKPNTFSNVAEKAVEPNRATFFKGATIWIENKEGKYMPKKYDEMTAAEKAALPDPPKVLAKVPTNEMVAAWKEKTNVYTICINDKYVDNSELAKYKGADFAYYSIRKPGNVDLRVNKNYGNAPNLVDMYTVNVHAKRFVERYTKPGKWLAVYHNKIWPGGIDGAETIRQYFKLEELKKTDPNAGMRWVLPPFKPEPIQ